MITNREMKNCREQIFSYSAAYQVPFYGREKTIIEMQEKTAGMKKGDVIVISQPLGTGKTFLINHMINNNELDIPVGANFLTVRGIVDHPETMDEFPGDTLVVDEADIKTPAKKLTKGLKILSEYLKESGRKAILLGDYSLKNPTISGCFDHIIPILEFEDMDSSFLEGVLKQRFEKFIDGLEDDFQVTDVMEAELLAYLAPDWMKSVNSFRGIFTILQQVTEDNKLVRYNEEKAFLTVEHFRSFLNEDESISLEGKQRQYLGLLKQYIKETYPKGAGITTGFQDTELYELVRHGNINMSLDTFREEILYPFATAGLLVSTGIPEYRSEDNFFIRRPAPYVPSLKLLLSII